MGHPLRRESDALKLVLRPAEERDLPFLWDMLLEAIYTPPGEMRPSRDILDLPEIHHYLGGDPAISVVAPQPDGPFKKVVLAEGPGPCGPILDRDPQPFGHMEERRENRGSEILHRERLPCRVLDPEDGDVQTPIGTEGPSVHVHKGFRIFFRV